MKDGLSQLSQYYKEVCRRLTKRTHKIFPSVAIAGDHLNTVGEGHEGQG